MLPGEFTLWTGRPDERVWLGRPEWFQLLGAVALLCFGAFWEKAVMTARTTTGVRRYPIWFAVVGVLTISLALLATAVQILAHHRRKASTFYTLTTARAIAQIGRRRYEAPAQDATIVWSRNRTHVSVTWGAPGRRGRASSLIRARLTTGTVCFCDVAEPTALITAVQGLPPSQAHR